MGEGDDAVEVEDDDVVVLVGMDWMFSKRDSQMSLTLEASFCPCIF